VKADNQIEEAVVQATKDFAQQIAVASGMEYRILKSTDADKRHYRMLLRVMSSCAEVAIANAGGTS